VTENIADAFPGLTYDELLEAAIRAIIEEGEVKTYADIERTLAAIGFRTKTGKTIRNGNLNKFMKQRGIQFTSRGKGAGFPQHPDGDEAIMALWRRKVRKINDIVERLNNDGVPHPRGKWSWHSVRRRMILLGLLACPTCRKRASTPKPKGADYAYRRKDDGSPGAPTPEQRAAAIDGMCKLMDRLGITGQSGEDVDGAE
jgi:hypothetical protein